MRGIICAGALMASSAVQVAQAAELEITHWWTSGGEATAAAELARVFEAETEHNWLDGAIAGSGGSARPIIISRIIGGDPMGATQLNHGRQSEELIREGLILDLTDIAEEQGWRDVVHPSSLLEGCSVDGRIYCVPLNIHSAEWLWLGHQAFEDAGIPVPTTWDDFVAASPALREAGKVPLAMGGQPWQAALANGVISMAIAGPDAWRAVNGGLDAEVAAGPEFAAVFQAAADARAMTRGSNVQDWNQATNLVITGQAGGQIMGDWAQGEFAAAGLTAGADYTCLPGLGVHDILSTSGDAIYFPVNDDPEITEAQHDLARVLISPETQVAFNRLKGSLPVRDDVDMANANECMEKGLRILREGTIMASSDQTMSPDTTGQIEDLMAEFWSDPSYGPEDAQARYADIIANAD